MTIRVREMLIPHRHDPQETKFGEHLVPVFITESSPADLAALSKRLSSPYRNSGVIR